MMVLSGMSDMTQMQDNISFMKDFQPLTETELAAVRKVQEIFRSMNLIPCTSCRYCVAGCPKQIAIPDLFAVMNTKQIYHDWNADYYYNVVYTGGGKAKASECIFPSSTGISCRVFSSISQAKARTSFRAS